MRRRRKAPPDRTGRHTGGRGACDTTLGRTHTKPNPPGRKPSRFARVGRNGRAQRGHRHGQAAQERKREQTEAAMTNGQRTITTGRKDAKFHWEAKKDQWMLMARRALGLRPGDRVEVVRANRTVARVTLDRCPERLQEWEFWLLKNPSRRPGVSNPHFRRSYWMGDGRLRV